MELPSSLPLASTWGIGIALFVYNIVTDLARKRREIKGTYILVTPEIKVIYIIRDFALGAVLIIKMNGVLFFSLFLLLIYCICRIFMTGEGKLINDRTDLSEKEKTQELINQNISKFALCGIVGVLALIGLLLSVSYGDWI